MPHVLGLDFAGVDVLNLTVGRVRYSSLRGPGKISELQLNVKNQVLTDIRSMADLTNAVLNTVFRNGITLISAPAADFAPGRKRERERR